MRVPPSKPRFRKITLGSLCTLTAVSVLLSGCASQASGGGNSDAQKLTLMVSHSVFSSTIQVAEDQGFFTKEKVTPEIVDSVSGAATVTALTAGAVDIGAPPPSLVIPAINLGAPIKVMMNAYDFDVLMVAKRGILSPNSTYPENMKQLKGLRVGVAARGGAFEQTVQGSLKAAGMDPNKDVAFVAIGVGQSAVQAFENNQVDVATFDATGAVFLPKDTYDVVATPKELVNTALSSQYMYSAWSTNGRTLETKANTVDGFCRAMKNAADFIRKPSNKDAVISSISKWTHMDPSVASAVYTAYAQNFDTTLNQKRWEGQSPFVNGGKVPAFQDATLASCVAQANS